MGKVRKVISKIIPKEIKPILPYAALLIPGLQGTAGALAKMGITNTLAQKALISGLTKAVTDDKAKLGDIARTAALSIGPDILQQGLGSLGNALNPQTAEALKTSMSVSGGGNAIPLTQQIGQAATAAAESKFLDTLVNPSTLTQTIRAVASPAFTDFSLKQREIQKEELEKYQQQMAAKGITDKAGTRKAIYDIYAGIEDEGDSGKYRVYSDEYINSILDKYGYARGGIVGLYKKGGEVEKPKPVELPQDPLSKIIEEFIKDQKRQDEIRKQYKANGGRIGFNVGGSSDTEALAAEVRRLQIENEALRKGDKSSLKDLGTLTDYATKGFEMATGSPLGGAVAQPQRIIPGFARGGVASLETVAMEPVKTENVQVASPDLYVKLVEYYESLGYDYDTASDLAYKDYMSGAKRFEKGGKVMQASHSGNDKLTEQLYEEFLEMGMTPQQARQAVKDYLNSSKIGLEEGGKVIPMIPEGIFYKGKAKDYPGASKAIRETLKEKREKKAEGGLLGLKKGGVPAEFDYRDGGIIKVGSKPKADDVPARLSLGEFVLTKESVDNLGKKITGKKDNRAGAEALYKIMDNLEAIA